MRGARVRGADMVHRTSKTGRFPRHLGRTRSRSSRQCDGLENLDELCEALLVLEPDLKSAG